LQSAALATPPVLNPAINTVNLGIVCPMANEEDSCIRLVQGLLAECDRFSFQSVAIFPVLDGVCKDKTRELLNAMAAVEPRLRVVWAPENRCVVDAYVAGYRTALEAGCDWILEIDAGFSHDPADLPQFFNTMAQGYDCVFGTRFRRPGGFRHTPLKRRFVSKIGTVLTNALLGTKLTDMTSGYELFSRQTLQMVLERGIRSRAHFFQTEIKVFCRGLKCAEVPITYSSPSPSLSNASLFDALTRLRDLFQQRLAGKL
jgi:dolichol-phosphate mannosyltransferase